MSKHTPGPWTVVGGSEVRAGARIVCITDAYGRHDDQLEPDARLIAAAPRMLAFIKTCADGLRNVTEDDARAILKDLGD